MKKFENIEQIINYEFPKFNISTIKKIGEGDNSKAFLINQNYIFRFPKREVVKQNLKKEIAVLAKIRSLLNLEIPNFNFISKEINFVGYKSISGEFLTIKIYNSLEKELQSQIQKSLAGFLSQLHNIDLTILTDCELETMNYKEEYSNDFKSTQKLIFPNISTKYRKIITQLFTTYLDNQKNFEYRPALIHNDFSTDHILFEISSNKISGIIDFGDLAIGDPDYDLMYLLDSFGQGFIMKMLNFYGFPNQKVLKEKLYFFTLANKLQITIGSIKEDARYSIKNNYANLERWMREYEKRKSELFSKKKLRSSLSFAFPMQFPPC